MTDETAARSRPSTRTASLEPQAISTDVLLEKYAKAGERTIEEVRDRVARALAEAEPASERARWAEEFRQAMTAGFIPGGRINSAAGTDLGATPIHFLGQPGHDWHPAGHG